MIVHFVQFVQLVNSASSSSNEPGMRDRNRMLAPIHIETIADLIARHHTLGLYCAHCDRWAEVPLERLAARGLSDRRIQRINFRCVRCGTSAQRQLRPPALSPARSIGWMEAQAPAAPTMPRSDPEPKQSPIKTTLLPSSTRRRRQRQQRGISWNSIVEQ